MLAFSPEVLSGPGGAVVAAVCQAGPAADRRVVADVVAAVAPGRSTTRRLAQALVDRPSILTDGRSPAPRVAADLLHALRELGVVVPAPRCTTCAKELATFCRRGQDCGRFVNLSKLADGLRICRGCEARLRAVPCARCGAVRDPVTRDGLGRPICPNCFMVDPANQEICIRCERRRPVGARACNGPVCPSCRLIQLLQDQPHVADFPRRGVIFAERPSPIPRSTSVNPRRSDAVPGVRWDES